MFTAKYNKRKIIFYVIGALLLIALFSSTLVHYVAADSATITIYETNIFIITLLVFIVFRLLKILIDKDHVLIMDKEGILFLPLKKGILKMGKNKWKDIESAIPREVTIRYNTLRVIELKLKNEANNQFKKIENILLLIQRNSRVTLHKFG